METNLQELLLWYRDSGIDYPLQDDVLDHFALSESHKQKSVTPAKKSNTPKPAVTQSSTLPDDQAIKRAIELSSSAKNLEELRIALEGFDGCNLKGGATKTVFSDGNPASDLMIIGEAPGREEDAQGLPFVGRSGQLLDKMLLSIGMDRTNTYITNVIAWRPPGNRTPTPIETSICRPFVERHIELVSPKVIVLMGGASTKTMLSTQTGILTLRGKWHELAIGGISYRVLPTLHPAYLLRQPLQKRLSWVDFLMIRDALR